MSTEKFPSIAARPAPEELHPALWRASQLARSAGRCIDSGHVGLASQLPGAGWPTGVQVDLHLQQPGLAELRLLAPALRRVAARKIVLIAPPHTPHIHAFAGLGLAPENLVWIRQDTSANTLWACELVLRSASVGAVLFWTAHARTESLRRLNLAAQAGDALFFMFRPLAAAQDASPAPLRLALRSAVGGIEVTFVKRRGPQRDEPLVIPLPSLTPTRTPGTRPIGPVKVPDPARHAGLQNLVVDLAERIE